MKALAIIPLFLCYLSVAQKKDSSAGIIISPDIQCYIRGVKSQNENGNYTVYVSRQFINKDFNLDITDTTYKIISFRVTFPIDNGDIVTWVVRGPKMETGKEYYKPYTLKSTDYSLITFDDVIVEKNGRNYRARPLVMVFNE